MPFMLKDSAVSVCPNTSRTRPTSADIGLPEHPTLATCGPKISSSEFARRAGALMSLREACRASLQACLESGWVQPMSDGCGIEPSKSLTDYDPATRFLRTRQLSLRLMTDEPSTELQHDWPKSGLIVSGKLFPLPSLVRGICANDFSSSLPTPIARDYKDTPGCTPNRIRRERSATAQEDTLPRRIYEGEQNAPKGGGIGGKKQTPEFRSWLMGFRENWLKPLADLPEMQLSRKSSSRLPEPSTTT